MPSAMGGFHEVLTKSLNELRAMLQAEHDQVVGELERKVFYLECKLNADDADSGVTTPSTSFIQRVKTDAGPRRTSGHPRRASEGPNQRRGSDQHPQSPPNIDQNDSGMRPSRSDPLGGQSSKRQSAAASSKTGIHDEKEGKSTSDHHKSLEPPKGKSAASLLRSSVQSTKSEGTPSMRNIRSDGGEGNGASGVRNFIRSAMRRKVRAQRRSRPDQGDIRSSNISNADVQREVQRQIGRMSSASRMSSSDMLADDGDSAPVGKSFSMGPGSIDPRERMLSPRTSKRSEVSHEGQFQGVWPAEMQPTDSTGSKASAPGQNRRMSADRQYRPALFKAPKSQDEELLDDDEGPGGAALASRVSLPKPMEPLIQVAPPQPVGGHRLSLAQQLTLMAFNPEIAAATASFQNSLQSQQALGGSPRSFMPPQSLALLNQDTSQLSDLHHHALHQVLFSDGSSPGDETCPTCDNCGNVFLLDAKFCRKCGKRRPGDQVCFACGNFFAPDALFCRNCGRARHSTQDNEDSESMEDIASLSKGESAGTDCGSCAVISSDTVAEVTPLMSPTSSSASTMGMTQSQSQTMVMSQSQSQSSTGRPRGRSLKATSERRAADATGEAEDKTSPEHIPAKLRQRKEKTLQSMKTKEDLEEKEKESPPKARGGGEAMRQRTKSWESKKKANGGIVVNGESCMSGATSEQIQEEKAGDRVQLWSNKDGGDSTAGDEPEKKERPGSSRPRSRRRGKSKDKGQDSRSRSPKGEKTIDLSATTPVTREAFDTSDGEASETDSEKRDPTRGSVESAAFSNEASEHSSSSEEGSVPIKPVPDPDAKRPSKKALRFSQKKRSITQGPPVTTPPNEHDEKPQPPPEAAPQLPMLHIPSGYGEFSGTSSLKSYRGEPRYVEFSGTSSLNGYRGEPRRVSMTHGHHRDRGGRNSHLLETSTSFRAGGLRGSLLGHMHSTGSQMLMNGFAAPIGSRRGSVLDGGGEWADEGSECSDWDKFELLGVWSTQIWRKSMRVKRDQAGDADEEDLDYGNYIVVNEAFDHVDQERSLRSLVKRLMIQPSSAVHLSWEFMGLVLIMWDVIFIPLDVYEPKPSDLTHFMTWVLRIFWLLDIVISFMTGYLQDQGTLEMRPIRIAKRYLRTWLMPDVLCVSMDWATVVLQSLNNYRGLRIVRSVRLFRLLKAPEIDAFITEHIHSDNVILAGNIIKSIILLMGVAHVIACIWYLVGMESDYDPGAEGWVRFHGLVDTEVQDRYMWSLQWALGQFTGENVYEPRNMNMSERTYAVIVLLITFLFASMFVSRITTSVTSLQLTKRKTAEQVNNLRRYLLDVDISTSLAVRVLRNAQHLVNEQKRNVPEERIELLAVVSEPLRAELHFEVHGRVLREHSFFDLYTDINPQGIRKVCHMAVQGSHVSRGDIIFSDLETPARPRMFFTVSGKLQYKQVDEKARVVQKDQWAAEAVLWTLWMHVGTLRAMGESDILAVEAEKFQDIISPFPTNHAYLYAHTFVQCLNNLEEDSLTDLDAKLADPYLKQIFPERFHEANATPDEPRHSGGVFAALPVALSPAANIGLTKQKTSQLVQEQDG